MYQYFAYISLVIICLCCLLYCLQQNGIFTIKQSDRMETSLLRIEDFIEKRYIFLLLGLFAVFLVSRLLRLDLIPAGIHLDELSMAYDAKCLAQYGTDRYGIHHPVYLQAYGDGMSALYAYLASIFIRHFGYSIRTIRYPAVLCASIAFFAAFLLGADLFKRKLWGLAAAALVMTTPFFMMSERWGLDCNLFLSMIILAFYFYVHAIKTEKTKYYVLAGIFLGITLYTYILSYLILPLFLICSILYLVFIKKFELKKTVALAVPLVILAFPLILFQLVNMGICPEFSFWMFDFRKLGWYRMGEFSIKNLAGTLSAIKLLLTGKTWITYNALQEYGTLYLFSIALVVFGILLSVKNAVLSLKKKEFDAGILLLFFTFWVFFVFVLTGDDNIHKANAIYFPFIFFMLLSIYQMTQIKKEMILVFVVCFGVSFLSFANFYFRYQNTVYGMHALFTSTEPGDVVLYEETHYNPEGKTVYIQYQYEHQTSSDLMVGLYGNVAPAQRTEDNSARQGHFVLALPENIDENEDAIYILGHNWNHIVSYMVSEWGFTADNSFPNYTILYR